MPASKLGNEKIVTNKKIEPDICFCPSQLAGEVLPHLDMFSVTDFHLFGC